jgi:hypothetical protein
MENTGTIHEIADNRTGVVDVGGIRDDSAGEIDRSKHPLAPQETVIISKVLDVLPNDLATIIDGESIAEVSTKDAARIKRGEQALGPYKGMPGTVWTDAITTDDHAMIVQTKTAGSKSAGEIDGFIGELRMGRAPGSGRVLIVESRIEPQVRLGITEPPHVYKFVSSVFLRGEPNWRGQHAE